MDRGGLAGLAAGGPDAVRVEVLAQALGVTKGGFCGHFADRNALLDEVLDSWERISIDEVLERVERKGGGARTKVRLAGRAHLLQRAAADRPGHLRLGPA